MLDGRKIEEDGMQNKIYDMSQNKGYSIRSLIDNKYSDHGMKSKITDITGHNRIRCCFLEGRETGHNSLDFWLS